MKLHRPGWTGTESGIAKVAPWQLECDRHSRRSWEENTEAEKLRSF